MAISNKAVVLVLVLSNSPFALKLISQIGYDREARRNKRHRIDSFVFDELAKHSQTLAS